MLRARNEEEIMDVIYKKIKGELLDDRQTKLLSAWMKTSLYYATLMDEISSDKELHARLLGKYVNDRFDFWKEVITYRAALHGGFKKGKGLFSLFRKISE